MMPRDIACFAFTRFCELAIQLPSKDRLCTAAIQAKNHEKVVEDVYALALARVVSNAIVEQQYRVDGFRGDLRVILNNQWTLSVEVKAPMTNHDGVRNKTRKPEHLPKDVKCLTSALQSGATAAFELVALFEAYGSDEGGNVAPANGRSIRNYEVEIRGSHGIKWPSRHDYLPKTGEDEVNAQAGLLGLERLTNWTRIRLDGEKGRIFAFVDAALFELKA